MRDSIAGVRGSVVMAAFSADEPSARPRAARENRVLAGLITAYAATFLICDLLTRKETGIPLLWPANAIVAVGFLHLSPRRRWALWAGIQAVGVAIHASIHTPPLLALVFMAVNSLEIWAMSLVVGRVTSGRLRIRSISHVILILLAVLPINIAMAAVGSALANTITHVGFWNYFPDWLSCTALGMAMALPSTLVILERKPLVARSTSLWAHVSFLSMVGLASGLAFANGGTGMPFLVFPVSLLASFKLGVRGAAWSTFITIAVATILIAQGYSTGTLTDAWGDDARFRITQVFGVVMFFTCFSTALELQRQDRLKALLVRRSRISHNARVKAQAAGQAKGRFLANMSHEIRTPLTAIIGFTELSRRVENLPPRVATNLDRIHSAGEILTAIVNDILDFSKIEAGTIKVTPQPINLADLVESVVQMFVPRADAKGVELVRKFDPSADARVDLDPERLRQILVNILGNAVKFTQQGTVSTVLSYDAAAGRALLEVQDTGPGFTEEEQQQLFQRFSQIGDTPTREHGGAGLGLAICRGLVEAMDGGMNVLSTKGRGTTFQIWLPAPPSAAEPDAPFEPSVDVGGIKLLVVDDNQNNRDLVRTALEAFGVELCEASNGSEGIAAAAKEKFDLILMDIRMPGMSGRDALYRIRTDGGVNAGTNIVAFTADTLFDPVVGCRDFDGVLHKPISIHALLNCLQEQLPSQQAA